MNEELNIDQLVDEITKKTSKPSINDTIARTDMVLSGVLTCIQDIRQLIDEHDIENPIHDSGLNYSRSEQDKIIEELLDIFSYMKYIEYLNKKMKIVEKETENKKFLINFVVLSQEERNELSKSILQEVEELNKNKVTCQKFYIFIIRRLKLLTKEI